MKLGRLPVACENTAEVGVSNQPVGIGERVAERRKLNGLTQAQLAHRAHVSLSLVRKVEQGSAPASPAFTATVATAFADDCRRAL